MNFYTPQHNHYGGSDLPAKALYVCILDQRGTKLVHKHLPTTPEAFLRTLAPYRADLVGRWRVSSPGMGWPTSGRRRGVPLSWATPSR